ncbi:MAG: glycosyltransferase [Pseudomonadota bacterium]
MSRRILIVASDLDEPSQRRTFDGLEAAGHEVRMVGFRRRNMPRAKGQSTELGRIGNGVTLPRLAALARGAGRLAHRREMRWADTIVVRNLDMALVALWAKKLTGTSAEMVYQCLDIHSVMTAPGMLGRLARWSERRVLRRSSLLVVSAPDFLTRYFMPRQRYTGPAQVQENRILWHGGSYPQRRVRPPRASGHPIVLGWVGTLRCPASFDLLLQVAAAGGSGLRLEFHGVIHHHQLPGATARIAAYPNVSLHGGYAYPDGLAQVYARLDCVWGQDMWQAGTNSDWLLPNRIYEAGYFGCPLLAIDGTATAAQLAAEGTGLVLPRASAEAVLRAVGDTQALASARARLDTLPAARFLQSPEGFAAGLLPPSRAPAQSKWARA